MVKEGVVLNEEVQVLSWCMRSSVKHFSHSIFRKIRHRFHSHNLFMFVTI